MDTAGGAPKRPKTTSMSYFTWWRTNPEEVDWELANYGTLRITQSARGVSLLLCLFTVAVTALLGRLVNMSTLETTIEGAVWLFLGANMYRGKRWAFVVGMVLWTLEKGYMLFGGGSGRAQIMQILFWVLYMRAFYLGWEVERLRAPGAPVKGQPPPSLAQLGPQDGEVFIISGVGTTAGPKDYVTPLRPDFVKQHGLPQHAIIGEVTRRLGLGERVSPDSFAANPAFADFLHGFLEEHTAKDPKVKAESYQIADGVLSIVDQRTKLPAVKATPEDIVATLQVANGALVPGSYKRGDQHLVLTKAGFFKLGQKRHADFLRMLSESVEAAAESDVWQRKP